MSVVFHRLTVADVRRETADAVSIAFAVPEALAPAYRFRPGQHLTLRTDLGGEVRRSYSICAAPDDGELRIAVKRVADGLVSRWANEAVKPGDVIDVMTPQGRFGLAPDPRARARRILAIAAGSGITPIMSIARSILAGEPDSRVLLIYGNRTSQSIIFREALADLKDRYLARLGLYHVLSRERQEISLLNGRIDGDRIATLLRLALPAEQIDAAFLCGPGGLTAEASAILARLGVAPERIHVEHFTADGTPVTSRPAVETSSEAPPLATATVRLNGSDHTVPLAAGETIIEAGLRAGLEMPYSCRGGMCCTCRARVAAGKVAMDVNYSLEPWELEAGYVLTCQSRPLTPEIVVDYDQV
jgi:ring-1,2-phenylacetyl-CoA epoxidase subunit PaaE